MQQLTDDEYERVELAVAKLPKTFVPLEDDAVPLGPGLLISNGFDLSSHGGTAILFNDEGNILHMFTGDELLSLKFTGRIPPSVPIPTVFDERGRRFLSDWVHELG